MLIKIEAIEEEKRALTEEGERKDRVIQQKEGEISLHREEVHAKEEEKSAEINRLKVAHSNEVEQLQLQIKELNTQSQLNTAKMEVKVEELKLCATLYESQNKDNSKRLIQESKKFQEMIGNEREMNKKLTDENHNLKSKLSESQVKVSSLGVNLAKLQSDVAEKKLAIQRMKNSIKRLNSEIKAVNKALEEKDATILAMREQFTKVRGYLTTKQQVSL